MVKWFNRLRFFWLSNPRPADCRYFCAYRDASPLRLHELRLGPTGLVRMATDQTVSARRSSNLTVRWVHPLTDAHTAGVIHSLRETQATKAPRRATLFGGSSERQPRSTIT